jgi:hypothetical protein
LSTTNPTLTRPGLEPGQPWWEAIYQISYRSKLVGGSIHKALLMIFENICYNKINIKYNFKENEKVVQ